MKRFFMQKFFIFLFFIFNFLCDSFSYEKSIVEKKIFPYKKFLHNGTYDHQDWSKFKILPKSRYYTFKRAFEHFANIKGKVIVELGTSRSFVHGGRIGCNNGDIRYWYPNNPENWDWGAGFFTRVVATALNHLSPQIHTVDIISEHIRRCKIITKKFERIINYHVCSSLTFLNEFNNKIDLLYIDTGDMTPIEPTAILQLEEAKIIVNRNLISKNGIILIDDVKNQAPIKFGETSSLGKAKYSIPYFLKNGFEIIENEYQVILKRIN